MLTMASLLTNRAVWVLSAVAALFTFGVGVSSCHSRAVDRAYRDGQAQARDSVQQEAARQVLVLEERLRVAQGRTDTVWLKTTRTLTKLDTLFETLHDTVVVQLPTPVQETLKVCKELQQDCAQLRTAVVTERAVSDSLRTNEKLRRTADQDTIRTLQRRPTRTQQVLTTGLGVLGGWLLGGRR